MVDLLTTYVALLQRGVALCDALARVYEPDAALDWASRTLMQTGNLRMGLAGRLANPQLTVGHTVTVLQMIGRYIDSHWADYQEFPRPDPAKRAQVLALHDELTAVMNEVATVDNAIYPSQPS